MQSDEIVRIQRGPRKRRSLDATEERLTTHKARSAWFQMRAAWPFREAPVATLVAERARALATLSPLPGDAEWQFVGPSNVGGRMTSVVCDPSNPEVIWAGSAGGGVWKSTDAGRTWTSLWHAQASLNIGALAIDPHDAAHIYCGTGEANMSADSYPGVGLFSSPDGGTTWVLLAASDRTGIPTRIGAIAIDPFDSSHLRIGGLGFSNDSRSGLFVSHDGGVTWRRENFVSTANHFCHSVVFDPAHQGVIFTTIFERGARSGIWRSRDGGASWRQLTRGLPPPESFGRISLAIAPSRPEVVYAIASNDRNGVLGVFASTDSGDDWREVGGAHFKQETQMSYGNSIAVHPTNPDWVLCGGVDLHLSQDGGAHWQRVTFWNKNRGQPTYAHADHHALLMPTAKPGRVYDMNDGGMDVSEDGGRTWANRSNGLAATMYYDLDVSQSDGRVFGGGTQDNGTNITTTGRSDDHHEILGGDGGWMVIDPTTPTHLYTSYYNLHVVRWRDGRSNDVSPPAPPAEHASVWMAFIVMDPSNSNVVYVGSERVWKTTNDGAAWTPVSAVFDGSAVTALEVAMADPSAVYVGTENGGFFRSLDGGSTWSSNLAGSILPGRTITRVASSPTDATLIFATVANFGNSHVFRSADSGTSWVDVDQGRLPDVPHNALAIPVDNPRTVYVGSDAGVHMSQDLGGTWFDLTRNLPHVNVVDLVHQRRDGTLTAATYGRSLWRLKVP
jgi:photosystem II stability/assembly factor-like uncharacterized protein